MQTRCPQCNTTFRVTEDLLQQAGGKVRCGHCQSIFDGRAHLIDAETEAQDSEETSRQVPPEETARPEIDFDERDMEFIDLSASSTSGASREEPDEEDSSNAMIAGQLRMPLDEALPEETSLLDDDSDRETAAGTGRSTDVEDVERLTSMAAEIDKQREHEDEDALDAADESAQQASAAEAEFVIEAPEQGEVDPDDAPVQRPSTERVDDLHIEEAMPYALRQDLLKAERPRRHWAINVLYGIGALILLAALLGQVVVFRNAELVHGWPHLRPVVSALCESLPCDYSGPQDITRISLVNRDVRSHPTAPNALLISATLINNADFEQSYPDILITLSDLSGTVVAKRRFHPSEYLDRLYNRFLLMESQTPVHIDLSVLDPGADAVNFEFEFL